MLKTFDEFISEKSGKPEAKVLSKEDYKKIWDEADVEKKKENALELLKSLVFKKSIEKAIKAVEDATSGEVIDKIITNISFSGEGLKVI